MSVRSFLIVVCCLASAACSLSPPKTWKYNYALRPMAAPAQGQAGGAPAVAATLRVAAVEAPNWLDGRDMYYQLNYSNRDRISAYSESRWLASPPVMIQRLMLQGLSGAGDWKAVIGADDNARADYVVHLRLMEFQQTFKSKQDSFGLLMVRATLIDAGHDAVLSQHTFRFEVPSPSADADGGAQALSKASHDLVAAVRQWLLTVMGNGGSDGAPG